MLVALKKAPSLYNAELPERLPSVVARMCVSVRDSVFFCWLPYFMLHLARDRLLLHVQEDNA